MTENQIIGPVWVTKYALTKGIQRYEHVTHYFDVTIPMIRLPGHWNIYVHGNDWHRTEKEASARAEIMRTAKLSSLRNQISKFETMKF